MHSMVQHVRVVLSRDRISKFRDRSFRDVCLFQVKGNTSGNMDNENRAG